MAAIAEELRNSFPLHSDERFGGISRMPAHLHLMYYQVRQIYGVFDAICILFLGLHANLLT